MKDMTFSTLLAVFEEIFGRGLFWAMVVVVVMVTLAYFFVLIRDRAVSWHKFLWAQLSMPVGVVLAVWFLLAMTHSKLRDMGGDRPDRSSYGLCWRFHRNGDPCLYGAIFNEWAQ
ncbi:hypothetical protein SAMN05444287_1253 [Octadecabacter temperatus]|uniref:Uncharacterized protein n=1 Tax=Octadecabacter temperatus TaxID=1458307 RepID=A0A0K0Y5I2_9RHOB|nr:hypothetical protein OSB_15960 [Octadecabacter temperatus]SIO08398.1 hypothetical protein SAMN05444287_1253 [Octadecabacter temperatus]